MSNDLTQPSDQLFQDIGQLIDDIKHQAANSAGVWFRDPNEAVEVRSRLRSMHNLNGLADMTTEAPVIHSDPEILGGTPVFVGTRVPMKTLLDYLEAGDSIDTFLDHFPSVRHEQAIATLELAKEILTAHANPA